MIRGTQKEVLGLENRLRKYNDRNRDKCLCNQVDFSFFWGINTFFAMNRLQEEIWQRCMMLYTLLQKQLKDRNTVVNK